MWPCRLHRPPPVSWRLSHREPHAPPPACAQLHRIRRDRLRSRHDVLKFSGAELTEERRLSDLLCRPVNDVDVPLGVEVDGGERETVASARSPWSAACPRQRSASAAARRGAVILALRQCCGRPRSRRGRRSRPLRLVQPGNVPGSRAGCTLGGRGGRGLDSSGGGAGAGQPPGAGVGCLPPARPDLDAACRLLVQLLGPEEAEGSARPAEDGGVRTMGSPLNGFAARRRTVGDDARVRPPVVTMVNASLYSSHPRLYSVLTRGLRVRVPQSVGADAAVRADGRGCP